MLHSRALEFELVNGRQIWGRRLHSHPWRMARQSAI